VACRIDQERGIMNQTMLAIGGLGTPEILVIAVVIFLLFGATRLPQLAKSLGQSKRAFKEGLEEGEREAQSEKEKNVKS
jgi:sec-independent protein translocase protein TatA